MRAINAVYKREVALFFRSGIAYAVAAGVLLFMGLIVSANVTQIVIFNQQSLQQGAQFGGPPQTIPASNIVDQILGLFTFLLFIVAPLLTMRLLAEEAREGTLEVLMTLPMSEHAFIIGKFLAAWTYYTVLLLLTLVYVVIVSTMGTLDFGILVSGYLGAWLYGGAVLAIAMIWSAVTEDQIIAAFLGAASVLVLFLADGAAVWAEGQQITAGAVDFLREISLSAHYQDTMLQGIIRGHDIFYFVALMITALFIITRIVETRRWRA